MSIEKVKDYFARYGMEERIKEFNVSSATVELAAAALNCEPCRIAKTLAFMVKDKPVLIVAAGDAKIDNQKFKDFFGTKAKMLKPEETVAIPCGRSAPLLCEGGVSGYLLKRFDIVFTRGSSNSAIELTIKNLKSIRHNF